MRVDQIPTPRVTDTVRALTLHVRVDDADGKRVISTPYQMSGSGAFMLVTIYQCTLCARHYTSQLNASQCAEHVCGKAAE